LKEAVPILYSGYIRYKDVIDIKLEDHSKLTVGCKEAFKGYRVSLKFKKIKVDMEPYALGYWLGDGHTDSSRITTDDKEIVDYFEKYVKELKLQFKKVGKSKYSYGITSGTNFGPNDRNKFLNSLKKYNLLGYKHIPDDYKFNTRNNQMKLLAGIIDSDGSYCKGGSNVFDITLKSEKLVDDIIFLCHSLGFAAYKSLTYKTCTNGKNGPVRGLYYRFCIYGKGQEEIPVIIPRKKANKRISPKDVQMTGVKINSIGNDVVYGLELDGNGRFLLSDFTVIKC